jgi:hypothetical protein
MTPSAQAQGYEEKTPKGAWDEGHSSSSKTDVYSQAWEAMPPSIGPIELYSWAEIEGNDVADVSTGDNGS